MKFRQFKSWFKKAYPDVEFLQLGTDLFSIRREKNTAIIKNFKDNIVLLVDNNSYKDDADILKKCKSLYGVSLEPYKFHLKSYKVRDFSTLSSNCVKDVLLYISSLYNNDKRINIVTCPRGINEETGSYFVIDNYVSGPILLYDGLQLNPTSTISEIIYFDKPQELLSALCEFVELFI